jgi:trimethylguanosine synthase
VRSSGPDFKALIASRYWQQRHSIFSKYDEGICMTDDAWFGVTPEPVAK